VTPASWSFEPAHKVSITRLGIHPTAARSQGMVAVQNGY
jgi:hypothetical protein